ncbi:poly(A) polymerase [Thermodesulfatator atlanticus]|uniref:poly(A) polymerase n=1 Tax=Thermodesulfatator atlanticus TaxID=501497 RepID=UPI0003B2E9BD|nr:poly(A) polymerase [Thermodesulfatator atlanticus]
MLLKEKNLKQGELFAEKDIPQPVIIPRGEHNISRKDISPEALKVLYRLKKAGYLAYLVGGSVRDLLLGIKPKDFDVGTDARPEEIRKLFRWSRIIGRRFRLVHVYFPKGKFIEVVTFRGPETAEEGIEVFGTPYQDAFRRDLTINALFYNISDFSIIDYVGGMKDLRAGIIRVIGPPDIRFIRDPVRMIRAIRHAARTGFVIEENTWEAILRHREKIMLCPVMRIRDEWLKDVLGFWTRPWAELMLKSGLFKEIFPSYGKYLEKAPAEEKKFFFKLLSWGDKKAKREELTEAQKLALFLYPFLVGEGRLARFPERTGRPTQLIRDYMKKVFYPFDFKKELFENTLQVLAGTWPIKFHLLRGNRMPTRLARKSYFTEALSLAQIIIKLEKEILSLEIPGKRRKRRRQKTQGKHHA